MVQCNVSTISSRMKINSYPQLDKILINYQYLVQYLIKILKSLLSLIYNLFRCTIGVNLLVVEVEDIYLVPFTWTLHVQLLDLSFNVILQVNDFFLLLCLSTICIGLRWIYNPGTYFQFIKVFKSFQYIFSSVPEDERDSSSHQHLIEINYQSWLLPVLVNRKIDKSSD